MPKYRLTPEGLMDTRSGEVTPFDPDAPAQAPMLMKPMPEYWSVVSDKMITSRWERIEDLKRNNCVEAGDMPRLNEGLCKNKRFARKHGLKHEDDV